MPPRHIPAPYRSCRPDQHSLMESEVIDLAFPWEGGRRAPSPAPAGAARRDQAVSSVRRLFTGGLTNHSTSPTTDAGTHCIERVLGAITLSGQEPKKEIQAPASAPVKQPVPAWGCVTSASFLSACRGRSLPALSANIFSRRSARRLNGGDCSPQSGARLRAQPG